MFPLFRTNKCNFSYFAKWSENDDFDEDQPQTISSDTVNIAICTKDLFSASPDVQWFVLCKSRCVIIARLRLTNGTAILEDDVWLNIHPGWVIYSGYPLDIQWLSLMELDESVSTIPLQLTTWSGYLVVKCWGAENHGGSWIIDLNNSPLPHPNKSFR